MNTAITHFLAVNTCLFVFYLLYATTIKKDTHFKQQRFFLLGTIFLSFIIPNISHLFTVSVNNKIATVVLSTVEIGAFAINNTSSISHSLIDILATIYFIIFFLLLSKLIYQIYVIRMIRNQSEFESSPNGDVYWTDQPTAFSFLKDVFIPKHLRNTDELSLILNHERAHIQQWHTIDIVIIEILSVLFWINPVVWLYRKVIKETHEYLADEIVKAQYNDTNKYEELLFSHGVGFNMGLTNSFNQSLTLKRLIMLTKTPSSPIGKAKILLIIPLAGLLTFGFACTQNDETPTVSETKTVVIEPKIQAISSDAEEVQDSEVFTVVEEMPQFPGGQGELMKYLQTNITYPPEAKANGIQGRVFVSFVVSKTGAIENVKLLQSVNELLDKEAIRVVKAMPNWLPGRNKNKPVNVIYNLPIKFALQ